MASNEMPLPPYFLIFEEVVPGAQPLAVLMGARAAVPLFDSATKAEAFLVSADLGSTLEPVEVSTAGLIRALASVRDEVDYVALNPPPAKGGGMKVRMGSIKELVDALEESRREDDLFGLGSGG